MKKIRLMMRLLAVVWAFILLAAGSAAREVVVRVAATSDLHGSLFPYDFEEDRPGKSSLAGVAACVDSIRALKRSNLILLDNGDLVQGTPVSYFANYVQSGKKNLFARSLNRMGYDAATVGNHDIEAGPAVYNALMREFRFPYLAANVVDSRTGRPWFRPYTVVEREGIRIAVIGLVTPAVPRWLPRHLWEGMSFTALEEAAAEWLDRVREIEKPDAVVGLFHTGYGSDEEAAEGVPREDAGRFIALNVSGYDLIILGHDHRPRNEILLNRQGGEVLILNPGSAARNLGLAVLTFRIAENRKPELVKRLGALIRVEAGSAGKSYMRRFRNDQKDILSYSNRPVGEIESPMRASDALFGNSSLTDLVHRVQLDITGADISFTAPLSVTGVIGPGTLYVRDLFRIYRYENYLYTMELSGHEIVRYLEHACGLWFNRMEQEGDHLLLFRSGEAAASSLLHPSYNFDSAAGIRYTVDVSKPAGRRVTITGMENGEPFDAGRLYRVAVNSYRGSGGGGHLTTGAGINPGELAGRILSSTSLDFRTLLMRYLEEQKVVNPLPGNNWQIVPAAWYEKGRERDRSYFTR